MSMKNSKDIIGDRTRDLPACGAVPLPTAPPRAPSPKNIYQQDIKFVATMGASITRWVNLRLFVGRRRYAFPQNAFYFLLQI
jgi:hypothetical protein